MTDLRIQRSDSSSTYGSTKEMSPRKWAGIVVTFAIHLILFWLVIFHRSEIISTVKKGEENVITLMLSQEKSEQANPAKAPPPPRTAPPKRTPKPVISKTPPIVVPPVVAVEPAPPPPKPPEAIREPEQDMSAMLDAARKRRAEAKSQNEAQEETEDQRANRIARANIARAGSSGRDQNDAGGVFQIRRVGVSSGEFFFRGWNSARGRTAAQLINVTVEPDEDIQPAMVRKMIDIIRAEKPGDFDWESFRLGKTVRLSALPEHRQELVAFLLQEFFPAYIPTRRKG